MGSKEVWFVVYLTFNKNAESKQGTTHSKTKYILKTGKCVKGVEHMLEMM